MSREEYENRYLSKPEVAWRYDMTTRSIDTLVHHPDDTQRLPPPALYSGRAPFWLITDLDRFDGQQMELSRRREIRRPAERYISVKGQKKEGARLGKRRMPAPSVFRSFLYSVGSEGAEHPTADETIPKMRRLAVLDHSTCTSKHFVGGWGGVIKPHKGPPRGAMAPPQEFLPAMRFMVETTP